MEDSAMSNLEAEAWNGSQHGTEGGVGGGVSTPAGAGGSHCMFGSFWRREHTLQCADMWS